MDYNSIKDGGQCCLVTTDEFLQIAEEVIDKKLELFAMFISDRNYHHK